MPDYGRFLRFLLSGGISAALTAVVRMLLSCVMSYELAVAIAYLIGMCIAFVLARVFVFERAAGPMSQQYIRFALVNAIGFPQVWLVSVGLAEHVFPAVGFAFHADLVAHVIGMATPVWSSYLGHKHFSFRGGTAPAIAAAPCGGLGAPR